MKKTEKRFVKVNEKFVDKYALQDGEKINLADNLSRLRSSLTCAKAVRTAVRFKRDKIAKTCAIFSYLDRIDSFINYYCYFIANYINYIMREFNCDIDFITVAIMNEWNGSTQTLNTGLDLIQNGLAVLYSYKNKKFNKDIYTSIIKSANQNIYCISEDIGKKEMFKTENGDSPISFDTMVKCYGGLESVKNPRIKNLLKHIRLVEIEWRVIDRILCGNIQKDIAQDYKISQAKVSLIWKNFKTQAKEYCEKNKYTFEYFVYLK